MKVRLEMVVAQTLTQHKRPRTIGPLAGPTTPDFLLVTSHTIACPWLLVSFGADPNISHSANLGADGVAWLCGPPRWGGRAKFDDGGSPEATRRAFNKRFLLDLAEDWQQHGREVFKRVRRES